MGIFLFICGGKYMTNGKSVVITAYGHEKTIDKIAVSVFDKLTGRYGEYDESSATNYCSVINSLKLEEGSWVFAQIIPDNMPFKLETFLPIKFGLILRLNDQGLQKVLREVDSQELAKAMKGETEAIQEKIFNSMSKRAAQMLKEDMEVMGPIPVKDVKEAQEKIVAIIHHLEAVGEIMINNSGETIQ
jgi:hypothetical protein